MQRGTETARRTFYAAVLVLEGSADRPDQASLYEETIVVVLARSVEEARERATEHGRGREHAYRSGTGAVITWRLAEIVDVAEVDGPLDDGAEVYTRHFRDYAAYRRFEPLLSGEPL